MDCGINANGLDEQHEEYLIKYSAVLLWQRAVETPCSCGFGVGIYNYLGQQDIIELKIWRGQKYNSDGEQQLIGYLDHYGLNVGYMLTFNFNKKKEQGVKMVKFGDKTIFEGTV